MSTTVYVKDISLKYEYAYQEIIRELNSYNSNYDTYLADTNFLYINLCTHTEIINLLESFYNSVDINDKVAETGISRSDYNQVAKDFNFGNIRLFELINILDFSNIRNLKEVIHISESQYTMIKLIKNDLVDNYINDRETRKKLIDYLRHVFIYEDKISNHNRIEVQCGDYNIVLEILYGFELLKSEQVYITIKEITHL